MPVRFPRFGDSDPHYLHCSGGVYPDLLRNVHDSEQIRLYPRHWNSLWLDIAPKPGTKPGVYPLFVSMYGKNGGLLERRGTELELLKSELPRQKLIHTRWLHADSLASRYRLPVFSVEHNRVLRNYVSLAARRGINMVLTPIHTPPIDTRPGKDRMTVQMADVFVTPAGYSFRFGKLRDFVAMCRHEGIRYFEMAHLFTQWGGMSAPKIMGIRDGAYTQLFGWDTAATSPEYTEFLAAYLPALVRELDYLDILDRCYFHLTDEPWTSNREQYRKLYDIVRPLLPNVRIFDTMSDPALTEGINVIPVPSVDRLEKFSGQKLAERWAYYCLGQHRDVPNTFIAMPGARTRILGVLLYLGQMDGFLHWGYNFYFSQYAQHPIDPYLNTDCDGFGPAGDAFQVYPGEGGQPEESLRLMLFFHAMQDVRALQLLEKLTSRDAVVQLIHEGLEGELSMKSYPINERWLLSLRHRVNQMIKMKAG